MLLQEAQAWVTLPEGARCSQEQVSRNLLRYLHTAAEGALARDAFVFRLSDGKNQSPPQRFHISIRALEQGSASARRSGCCLAARFSPAPL